MLGSSGVGQLLLSNRIVNPAQPTNPDLKQQVESYWQAQSCGEVYLEGESLRDRLSAQERTRYLLEPYIFDFAKFDQGNGQRVVEIGVGMGADHLQWAVANPHTLVGVDLTMRGINFTRSRLRLNGLHSELSVADAENLPLPADAFDIVYSWGVLHHTPDTRRAIGEVWRVLRKGGVARVMIYHSRSIVGYLLWLRYALFRGRPHLGLAEILARYLESPGTKAYTRAEAHILFADFQSARTSIVLSAGDLLEGAAGQRHEGRLLAAARKVWPREIVRKLFAQHGLFLLIEAVK